MNLERILALEKFELEAVLRKLELEFNDTALEEELQALLFSFVASHDNFDKVYDLCCLFDEPYALVDCLVESSNGRLSNVVLEALIELRQAPVRVYPIIPGSAKVEHIKVRAGTSLIFVEDSSDEVNTPHNAYVITDGNNQSCRTVVRDLPFGHHEFRLYSEASTSESQSRAIYTYHIFASSAVYSYCMAVDSVLDRLHWGWEGQWTMELEGAILELLVAIDSELVPLVIRLNEMMTGLMGSEYGKELETLLSVIHEDMAKALTSHCAYAVGRLHQTLLQLREMNSSGTSTLMSISDTLMGAIDNFIRIKVQSSPMPPLSREINALVRSARMWQTCPSV